MFPRGPRFPPAKVPEVPGPNSYNLNQESQLDEYKRGAFLEKADRFSEEKASDIPGPGAYNTNTAITTKHAGKPSTQAATNERYDALLRKLEDLEKIHLEGKKAHAAELERVKFELSRMQKANADQTERIDKLKKHNDAQETRLQELRKVNLSDQSEIKELRVKLRVCEHDRGQLASKLNEGGELKKILAGLEAKRKEELRERDRRIAELEKLVAAEKRKREGAETMLQEARGKADGVVEEARETAESLKEQVKEAKEETRKAQMQTFEVEKRGGLLISELNGARSVIQRVAEDYGRLAASTVSIVAHEGLKREHNSLTFRAFRLERKLANSEAQVVELAHLIRGTKDQSNLLSHQLTEAREEIEWYAEALRRSTDIDPEPHIVRDPTLDDCIATVQTQLTLQTKDVLEAEVLSRRLFSQHDNLRCQIILQHYGALSDDLHVLREQKEAHEVAVSIANSQRDELRTQLEAMRREYEATRRQASEYSAYWEESKASENELKREMEAREKQRRTETTAMEEKLKKDRDSIAHLTSTLQQIMASEDSLRAEIDQLTSELMEAARYQDAYNTLVEEIGSLIDRNELAEEEAEKLSKFNAEILGHNNPSQRIMYVDRIRKELAETKQTLLAALRERNAVDTHNEDLRRELDLYKSVSIPIQDKPRTTITRVGRTPLVTQNLNVT